MANIPVKWAHNGMRGAPVINGVVGSLLSAIRTFLITGFAPTAAVSATVLDGIATIMLPSGQSFEEHAVVLLGGATTAGFNGEERVITTASDRITVATSAPNGPVAGSITVRYAPVGGWEEVFTKTNVSVFRSTNATGARMYLRIDDTGTLFARVVAYESMVDVDSGSGAFPTASQMAGGGYWHKSTVANANAAKWKMYGDSKFFGVAVAAGSPVNSAYDSATMRGFGDTTALAAGGDPWSVALSVSGVSTSSVYGGFDATSVSSATIGGIFQPRGVSGLGSSIMVDARPFSGGAAGTISGVDQYLGAAPSEVDGQIKPSRQFLKEQPLGKPPRCVVPGLFYIPQSGLVAITSDGDFLPGGGELSWRRLWIVSTSSNYTIAPTGRYAVDITGPI